LAQFIGLESIIDGFEPASPGFLPFLLRGTLRPRKRVPYVSPSSAPRAFLKRRAPVLHWRRVVALCLVVPHRPSFPPCLRSPPPCLQLLDEFKESNARHCPFAPLNANPQAVSIRPQSQNSWFFLTKSGLPLFPPPEGIGLRTLPSNVFNVSCRWVRRTFFPSTQRLDL